MKSKRSESNATPLRWSLAALVLMGLALSISGIADRWGEDYTQQGFKRALATFAIARALNGVISVAQETELVLQPVGVGVTLAPGQILDPINDLVERFSWVMLAAATSLGVQNVLLDMAGWWGFSLLIGILAGLWWWFRWRGGEGSKGKLLSHLLVLALILRFAVPVMALVSEGVFKVFLEPRYAESVAQLEQVSHQVESLNQSLEKEQVSQPSLADRARQLMSSAGSGFSLGQKMQDYKDAASRATESAVELIVIFVFQTILMPLVFLWLLIRIARSGVLWGRP